MTQTPETPESLGLRLLELVSRNGYSQDEALALIAAGANVNVESFGITALHWAAGYGHTDIALALIEKGAKVSVKNEVDSTALHWAVWHSHGDTALALIGKGAELGAKDCNGDTAEMLARKNGYTDLADRIRAIQKFERATRGFREGLENDLPTPPPLRVKKRSVAL